jgi:hypothetical protein
VRVQDAGCARVRRRSTRRLDLRGAFWEAIITNTESKAPTKSSTGLTPYSEFFGWPAFDHFRRQMDSFFHDLPGRKFLPEAESFERFFTSFSTVPAVDLVEKENEYSISDEKKDEREEKDKNYSFSERRYGAFRPAPSARPTASTRTRSRRVSTRAC